MSKLLDQIKHQYARLTGALDEDPRIALHRKTRRKIKELNYPMPHGFHEQYRHHLDRLNVADLRDFIAWIPYERFRDVQLLSKGTLATVYTAILPSTRDEGFAIVKKGELHSFDGRKEKRVALKEMDDELIQEVCMSALYILSMRRIRVTPLNEPTRSVLFFPSIPSTSPLKSSSATPSGRLRWS